MGMSTEQWIVAGGIGFVLALIVTAMLPDDVWDSDIYTPELAIANVTMAGAGTAAPGMGAAPQASSRISNIPQGFAGAPQGGQGLMSQQPQVQHPGTANTFQAMDPQAMDPQAVDPQTSWARPAAMPGLTPFNRATTERFSGTVHSNIHRGADMGWGQVHIWISNGVGDSKELSLAPGWYLEYLGCPVFNGDRVKGVAFNFDKTTATGVTHYAKDITVNGKTCRLRNDEGFALWSNQLR
ncbi:MAG: hypothetical protein HQL36_02600 [Alphaproteobacteria bacterium]|nr:hypothetical protein [Alphaproteobacteria bacterium]